MPTLSSYTNVFNTALVILKRKGFRVWMEQGSDMICAEKDGWDFMAEDPIRLLGLIAIYEAQQPGEYCEYWWKIDSPWLIESVSNRRPRFIPVWKRKSKSPAGKVSKTPRTGRKKGNPAKSV